MTFDKNLKFSSITTSGISFKNTLTSTASLNILNYLYFYNGAGVALADFNNDGLEDIYFTSNQESDQLYLNLGNLRFENITLASGIENDTGWTTGVTTTDVNNDGLMDIYISKVSQHLDLKGSNLLYINQGNNANGQPTFKEQATEYGLDITGLCSQATFFDYDLDGDLDAYILRHSLYPNSNYGLGKIRNTRDSLAGDLLLENVNGTYMDASAKANIFSSSIGYGLGISTGDVNKDGYPDIYIGNDFFENDYLYINQGDGTFKDSNSSDAILGHTSHFSMGNAIEDLTNDGRPDIISVDMLPENLETFKSSGQEYNYALFQNQLRSGYQPQFMQNTLHLNLGDNKYTEIAFASGIAATEWSWAPLVADFDNDGYKDLYITNGILGASNDMDFVSFISDGKIQKQLGATMDEKALDFIKELPEKRTPNYIFQNKGQARFKNMQGAWIDNQPSLSNGAIYGDLDNDGDMDIVVNNINETAFILENNTRQDSTTTNYLKIKFEGTEQNKLGTGTKVYLHTNDQLQYFQNFTTTGYLSAKAPTLFAGLGENKSVDSIKVIWPNLRSLTLYKVPVNQTLTLKASNATQDLNLPYTTSTEKILLKNTVAPITYKHKDAPSLEFSRDGLVPYASTNLGPKLSIGDLNSDDLEDIITLGGKGQETTMQIQLETGMFETRQFPDTKQTQINEDVAALIFDANNDNINDVIIVSGGNEFKTGEALRPRFYVGSTNGFIRNTEQFQNLFINASTIKSVDLDNDGDQDITITANVYPRQFGKTPTQYIFKNDGLGNFTNITARFAPEFQQLGNIQDIIWKDLDSNGYPDAIIAGHWMPITIFMNNGNTLQKIDPNGLENTNGWWNTINVADVDNDGDLDILAGNWGLNTRLKPSLKEPVRLYRDDFDKNGQVDPVVTYFYNGKETTIATKDEMVKQLPYLNKKFLSYTAFAKADIEELLGKKQLQESEKKEAYEFASIFFENKGNNTFESHTLPFLAQTSTVHDILVEDFDNDGYLDALLVGNNYEISTQLGRLDGSHGVLLKNDKNGGFTVLKDQLFNITGASRSIEKLKINQRTYYVVGRNNDTLLFLTSED